MPSVVSSAGSLQTRLQPSTASAYLNRLIITTLQRRGVDAAEAGVIAEMERLLEHHVQTLFESSRDYASLAGRLKPNASDVLAAQGESSHPARKLKRESKRRRKEITLPSVSAPAAPTTRETIDDWMDFLSDQAFLPPLEAKPALDRSGNVITVTNTKTGGKEDKLAYAYDGAPSLPLRWTYAQQTRAVAEEDKAPPVPVKATNGKKVVSNSLDFVKSTIAEAGIDPELGIVHYRRQRGVARES